MSQWLLRALGVSDELAQKSQSLQWLWHRPGWLAAGLVLLPAAVWFVVARHRAALSHVPAAQRHLLSAARSGVLLLLVLVLGAPYVRLEEALTRRPALAILVDDSASMDVPARQGGAAIAAAAGLSPTDDAEVRQRLASMSRRQLLEAVLAAQRTSVFDPLAERFATRVYRVGRIVRHGSLDADDAVEQSQRHETALGEALETALRDAAGGAWAGVVIFSDGRGTTSPEALQAAQRDALPPIFTVPVGSDQPVIDLAVRDVLAPQRVIRGDQASVTVVVAGTGLAGRGVRVSLHEGQRVAAEQEVELQDGQRQRVTLRYTPARDDARVEVPLLVSVQEQAEETVTQNNHRRVWLELTDEKLDLLYLEGAPRWDFRFLDHALRRDTGVNSTIVMEAQLAGAREELSGAALLPQTVEGWARYDVALLGDVSPALLPGRFQEQLLRAVEEEGLGLVVQAGTVSMPMAFADGPLAKLMPMERWRTVQAAGFAPLRMSLTAVGGGSAVFELFGDAERSRRLWAQMPSFFWATTGRLRPGATALAELEDRGARHPLVIEQHLGRGRVVFVGTDSTFLWRRNIGDELFYRFWGQTLRHAARQGQARDATDRLEISPRRIETGQEAVVELFALDRRKQPLDAAQQTVRIVPQDAAGVDGAQRGSEARLTLHRGATAGGFRGSWRATEAGEYRVVFDTESGRQVSGTLSVATPGREWSDPSVDRDTLGTLADLSGGALLELDQLATLPTLLRGEPTQDRQVRDEDVWDTWLTLVLLVGLYCTDVAVRRVIGVL